MKKALIIIAAVLVFLFVIGLTKDLLLKSVVEVAASQVTGAPVRIGGFSLGLLKQSVRITDFILSNPSGFPQGTLLDIAEMKVAADLPALMKKQLHLKEVVFSLKEVVIIKNKEGKLNIDALKVAQKKEEKKPQKKEKRAEQMPFRIDVLKMRIGKVISKDISVEPPKLEVFDAGYKETIYKNITSPEQLVVLVLSESARHAAIKGAAIYGAASLAGVAFLPAGVAAVLIGKDSATQEFSSGYDNVYAVCLDILTQMGKVEKEDKAGGWLKAKVNASDVAIKVESVSASKTKIIISARKLFIPQLQQAQGLLYQITEKLNK